MANLITTDIQKRMLDIEQELNETHKERPSVIRGVLIAAVSNQHMLLLGPGGTGKSFLIRDFVSHITGAKHFEVALDETSDPSQVLGPPDIKAMVEDGKTRRVLDNMFADAHYAFLDEFFNANGPTLHSVMPGLNERVVHNNGTPSSIPLRSAYMGTNKLNADADQAALWDRVHQRHVVSYVQDRNNQADMVMQAIGRLALLGRGTNTTIGNKTTVSLEEMDQAFNESLGLIVEDPVMELFLNIREELRVKEGIEIGDRRMVEGMAAVLASAWINGHESVTAGDMDVLQHMWWVLQDQIPAARAVILQATNPGEKAALDLLDELDTIKQSIKEAQNLDDDRKRRVGVEAVKNCDKLLRDAGPLLEQAQASGSSTTRIKETIEKAEAFKLEVGRTIFGLDPTSMANMTRAAK